MPPCPRTSSKRSPPKPQQSAELGRVFRWGLFLKQRTEHISGYSSLAQDRSQCARIKFRMIRHDHLCEWNIASKNDVAAVLPFELKS